MDGYATSLNFKEEESGEGRTFYYRVTSPTETLSPELLPFDYIRQAKVLHMTGVFCAILEQNRAITLRALECAKENDVTISFDPNIRLRLWSKEEARETILTYLPFVDHLLVSKEELELLFDTKDEQEILTHLGRFDFKEVVMKDGQNGAFALVNGKWLHVPGVKVAKVVDTVGAGDGFDSGYLYGLLQEWPIEERLVFANAIGAMVVQVNGDNEGLPYLEDVESFLGKREIIER
jgi:2-dehydro-3-deoxygluconokinase